MASSIETTSTTTTLKNNGNTYLSVDTNDDVAITNTLTATSPTFVTPNIGAATVTSLNGGQLAGNRNKIINGDMRIDQRNSGAAVTTNGAYVTDRWFFNNVSGASVSGEQVQDAPAGFIDSLKYKVTNADASLDADDRSGILHNFEGYNCAEFGFGTADAKSVTISFWVKSSITGSFGGSLQNFALNRSYPFSYTISSASTWEYKTVTIPGDTSGTWNTDNTRWGRLYLSVGMGSTRSGSAGSWTANDHQSFTGAANIMSTLNATWNITGVQLEAGTVATPFEHRSYGTELALCQRYFQLIGSNFYGMVEGTNTFNMQVPYWRPMRAAATVAGISGGKFNARYQGDYTTTDPTTANIQTTSEGVWLQVAGTSLTDKTTIYGRCQNHPTSNFLSASAEL